MMNPNARKFPEQIRRASAKERVLRRLLAGPATNVELSKICLRYGARLFELRREWIIESEPLSGGLYRFTLRGKLPTAPLLALAAGGRA